MEKKISLFLAFLLLLGCSSGDEKGPMDDDGYGTPPPEEENAVRLVSTANFGKVLADGQGRSLYFFSLDAKGGSNCSGDCLGVWPVFHTAELTLDAGLESGDFGSIAREDGTMQTTYKGWPLYYYASDGQAGDVQGDGINGLWYVAKPDYTLMLVRAQLVGRDSNGTETNLTGSYEPGEEQTTYMTDAQGNTLYLFVNDTYGVNNFTAEDFSNNGVWPIFEESLGELPSAFAAGDFGSIDVHGRQQLTYRGWPLYYFGQDQARGDNFGVGYPSAGIWPIANADTQTAPQAESGTISYTVVNQDATAFLFSGDGLEQAVNPGLTLKRGSTYEFNVNAPGHPFWIKTEQSVGSVNSYDSGITENGTSSGTLRFTVPADAPNVLYYVCEFHSPMSGTLTITD